MTNAIKQFFTTIHYKHNLKSIIFRCYQQPSVQKYYQNLPKAKHDAFIMFKFFLRKYNYSKLTSCNLANDLANNCIVEPNHQAQKWFRLAWFAQRDLNDFNN